MKKGLLLLLGTGVIFLSFQSFIAKTRSSGEIPEEVKTLLGSSCYICHNSNSSKMIARIAFNLDKWDAYKVTRKIKLLNKINEFVTEEKMPPEKYLVKNPEKKLSETQAEVIIDWTISESGSLMDGN